MQTLEEFKEILKSYKDSVGDLFNLYQSLCVQKRRTDEEICLGFEQRKLCQQRIEKVIFDKSFDEGYKTAKVILKK
jgi:hypothetical protein